MVKQVSSGPSECSRYFNAFRQSVIAILCLLWEICRERYVGYHAISLYLVAILILETLKHCLFSPLTNVVWDIPIGLWINLTEDEKKKSMSIFRPIIMISLASTVQVITSELQVDFYLRKNYVFFRNALFCFVLFSLLMTCTSDICQPGLIRYPQEEAKKKKDPFIFILQNVLAPVPVCHIFSLLKTNN